MARRWWYRMVGIPLTSFGNGVGGISNIPNTIMHFVNNISHINSTNALGYIIILLCAIYIFQNLAMITKNVGRK
jgi:hypothetical protein